MPFSGSCIKPLEIWLDMITFDVLSYNSLHKYINTHMHTYACFYIHMYIYVIYCIGYCLHKIKNKQNFYLSSLCTYKFLNQMHTGRCVPGFLKSLSCGWVYVCVCMCVHCQGYTWTAQIVMDLLCD